jgi:predicted acetyltransferase
MDQITMVGGGGHIGYDVRPSARRHAHATVMLAAE